MLDVYERSCAIIGRFAFSGEKSESERFPGAVQTLCLEAMVQDRKAIQAGTSHFRTEFWRARVGFILNLQEPGIGWTTSWGMTTRPIGTGVMATVTMMGLFYLHGLRPSTLSSCQLRQEQTRARVLEAAEKLEQDEN